MTFVRHTHRADVLEELCHEALAKPQHFTVRLSLGVEVRAPFAAPHGEGRERVLEDLFEAEELDDREIHRRMETLRQKFNNDVGLCDVVSSAAAQLSMFLGIDTL